jgi:endogenous inhibitor of DNA gyrase (YacG/DUF329 family)
MVMQIVELPLNKGVLNCPFCKKLSLKNYTSLNVHLKKIHLISIVEYFENLKFIPKCMNCENNAKWIRSNVFHNFCSKKCQELFFEKFSNAEMRIHLSHKRKKYLKENKNKHNWSSFFNKNESEPEERFAKKLENLIIDDEIIRWYIPKESERFFELDFAFLKNKIAFEINGNQHYDKSGQLKEYFKNRQIYLESLGWKIINVRYLLCFKEDEIEKIIFSVFNNCKFSNLQIRQLTKQEQDLKYKKDIEIKIQLLLNSNIDFSKYGWVQKAAAILNVPKASKWIKKYMSNFYEEKCFKIKSSKNSKCP